MFCRFISLFTGSVAGCGVSALSGLRGGANAGVVISHPTYIRIRNSHNPDTRWRGGRWS